MAATAAFVGEYRGSVSDALVGYVASLSRAACETPTSSARESSRRLVDRREPPTSREFFPFDELLPAVSPRDRRTGPGVPTSSNPAAVSAIRPSILGAGRWGRPGGRRRLLVRSRGRRLLESMSFGPAFRRPADRRMPEADLQPERARAALVTVISPPGPPLEEVVLWANLARPAPADRDVDQILDEDRHDTTSTHR